MSKSRDETCCGLDRRCPCEESLYIMLWPVLPDGNEGGFSTSWHERQEVSECYCSETTLCMQAKNLF